MKTIILYAYLVTTLLWPYQALALMPFMLGGGGEPATTETLTCDGNDLNDPAWTNGTVLSAVQSDDDTNVTSATSAAVITKTITDTTCDTSVYTVTVCARVRGAVAAVESALTIYDASSNYQDVAIDPDASEQLFCENFATDPAGGAWSISDVNDLRIGVKNTATGYATIVDYLYATIYCR